MKNLILKMVARDVLSSSDANDLINKKSKADPVWSGLETGVIDEDKLAKFYEKEGYPVIYEEGVHSEGYDYFARFFTPDIIAKYLVFPISFKKESKDIIIGFINSVHLDSIRFTIQKVFPDFNTTFFHFPYSIFKKGIYRNFMIDIDKFIKTSCHILSIFKPKLFPHSINKHGNRTSMLPQAFYSGIIY